MPAQVATAAQMKAGVETRPWAAPRSRAGFSNGLWHGQAGRCWRLRPFYLSWRSCRIDLLAGDVSLGNTGLRLATSQSAAVNLALCSQLGAMVWVEVFHPRSFLKEQWKTCGVLLVQKFSLVLSVHT